MLKKIERHLDPVFIYPFKEEIIEPAEKDYIIVYGYDERIHEDGIIEGVKRIAKKFNKKIISIGGYQRWCDENIAPSPFEVLGYFKNADFIVTDTFHGTVFSIKYQKKFATVVRSQNKQKLLDLLDFFGLKDRIVDHRYSNIEEILLKSYDAQRIEHLIESERVRTREYLGKICEI